MRKPLFLASLLVVLVVACNQNAAKPGLLKPAALRSSIFTIDITKDTTLKTAKGAIIRIPKGALVAEGAQTVRLEIKEAYTIREILRAGLTTQSNGQPLSSGGMIYINAVGENTVRVQSAIEVSIPTPWINKNMQLYKGEIQPDSSVNWVDPDTIPAGGSEKYLERGMVIFRDNCSRCHSISRDLVGPALAYPYRRIGQEEWQPDHFEFTWNSQKVLASGDPYYNCLYQKWNKLPMPAFPELTMEEMTALYDYIENESYVRGIPYPADLEACYDSCENFVRKKLKLRKTRDSLIADNFNVDTPAYGDTTLLDPISEEVFADTLPDLVGQASSARVYYQFKVEAFGWFNVDILFKNIPGFSDSELRVNVQGEYKNAIDIYLVIPSQRIFLEGGLLNGKQDEYGFFTPDGKIPLPINDRAYILAMSEINGTIRFDAKAFVVRETQRFELNPREISRGAFNNTIRTLGLGDFKLTVQDSKNAADIHAVGKSLDSLKPVSPACDCICAEIAARYAVPADSTRSDSERLPQ